MKRSFFTSGTLSFMLLLSACNNEQETSTQTTGTDTAATEEIDYFSDSNAFPVSSADQAVSEVPAQPVQSVGISNTNPGSEIKLNPEHGQPGHRCDIPVGAPLNTPPAVTSVSQPQTMPAKAPATAPALIPTAGPAQPAPAPAPAISSGTNGNVRLNPEHGQPGHRCDIPVGQPLP